VPHILDYGLLPIFEPLSKFELPQHRMISGSQCLCNCS
jgi:hypothetical protein